ncbi:MAG: CorA family divalent cation transporter [Eubacteriales bacterium]|nr:CorA family divalent cation transporter [Eubacteriales bacterium]
MIIFADKKEKTYSSNGLLHGPAAIIADFDQHDIALNAAGIELAHRFSDTERKTIRFESRNNYDYFLIYVPDFIHPKTDPALIEIYITKEFLVVLGDNPLMESWKKALVANDLDNTLPAQMLSLLLNQIMLQNHGLLEKIEDEIEKLEEYTTQKNPGNYSKTFTSLLKRLLNIKRYFEALYDMLEDLEENRNNLFSSEQLSLFRAHKNKVNRKFNNVINLRDYLSQVHGAYQNQLDISLNNTMSFFTVITSIFLPLTLLVGWYGMNLQMPEIVFKITYPIVIVVSVVYVILALIFAKKKGWL